MQSGWNTFSYSEGLSVAEVEELEQKCQLQAGLKPEDFPVFCAFNLSTGRRVICQSAFIGKSFYDGRPGATFTHAFIIEKEEQWPLPPISYMGSPSFMSALSKETQQKALYYREHRREMVPPPYLPVLLSDSLVPNEEQSETSIQVRLQEPAFAEQVSRLIACRESLRAEQLPLRFRAAAGEYAPLLAALSYLAPEFVGNGSFSSLCCTDSGAALYSFFSIVGTKDSHYHIDVTAEPLGGVALHPLVECAKENLAAWYSFTSRFSQAAIAGETKRFLFDLAHRRKTSMMEAADIHRIAAILHNEGRAIEPKEWCRMLGRYEAFEFCGESGASVASAILGMVCSPSVFSDMSEAQRVESRRLMQRVLLSLAECLNTGTVTSAQLQRTLKSVPLAEKLWLSAPMQQRLFGYKELSEVPWKTVAVSLSLQGAENNLWENGKEARRLYTLCSDLPDTFARYLGCFPSPERATAYLMQTGAESELPASVREGYLFYVAARPSEAQKKCLHILLGKAWYQTAAGVFRKTCGVAPDYKLMAEAASTAASYPEYEALLMPSLLQMVPDTPYTREQGVFLLQAAKQSGAPYREAWQSCLLKGFPVDSLIDDALIKFASGIVSLNEQVEENLRPQFNYCRLLVLLGRLQESGPEPVSELQAFTNPDSPDFIGQKDKNKIDDRILSYLLLHARQNGAFAQWLNPRAWGWDATTLLIAVQGFCEARIREYRQYRFDERGIGFLQAVLGIKEHLPGDSLERELAPLFFRGVTSREKKEILRRCPGDVIWLKSCMRRHSESISHKILSFLSFK